ncbi:hypothetical protein HII31_04302 [Pseudocercospora fuligena]|uniref:Uncharacterized protein n=1 Tax=Pseudocercospora fuligena TaxID=685502 RepID=A0A8H6RNH2_9PEZI|nr:hypothetical protein HII31_04302 [Pseudocercospora fuligena]
MAAVLLVFGAVMLKERVEKSKAQKAQKKELDESRYRDLVEETERRLSRTESGQVIRHQHSGTESEDELESEHLASPVQEDEAPPAYGYHGRRPSEHEVEDVKREGRKKKRFSFLRRGR